MASTNFLLLLNEYLLLLLFTVLISSQYVLRVNAQDRNNYSVADKLFQSEIDSYSEKILHINFKDEKKLNNKFKKKRISNKVFIKKEIISNSDKKHKKFGSKILSQKASDLYRATNFPSQNIDQREEKKPKGVFNNSLSSHSIQHQLFSQSIDKDIKDTSQCQKVDRSDLGIILDCPGIEVGVKVESLDNGFDDWTEFFISGESWIVPDRSIIFAKFRETNRFDRSDEELLLGTFITLDKKKKWGIGIEVTGSPSHRVLPEWSVKGKLKHSITSDFAVEASFQHAEFNVTEFNHDAEFNQEELRLEKEFGQFLTSYTLGLTQVRNAGDGITHLFEGRYYYSQNKNSNASNVGLKFLIGEVVEDQPQFVIRNNVWSFIIDGKHLFDKHWGITYNFNIWDNGEQYTRIGGGLGLRYEF